MAQCPAYAGPICSLCCSLEARCHDCCKPHARLSHQIGGWSSARCLRRVVEAMNTDISQLSRRALAVRRDHRRRPRLVYFQVSFESNVQQDILESTLWTVFFLLSIIAAVAAWLFVLVQREPPRRRGGDSAPDRIADAGDRGAQAHRRRAAAGQGSRRKPRTRRRAATWSDSATSCARRSTPSSATPRFSSAIPRSPRGGVDAIRVIRRSAEHLSGLIDGLLDISKIEAGRFDLNRDEVRLPRIPRPARRHVPPPGRRQRHRIRVRARRPGCRVRSTPTRTGCGRS